ncbi:LETM1-like protein, putative [Plasmodium chabaudi adami]|uniref:LETM1-like protein, putative n=1 Tax=Plasmodium chabaudi adami TaxID=5826 RepID=A0A1C6XMD8_PLACE|nr:LETM1-like protein, putative [Plasmodium chabaudi adami]
MAWGLVNIQKNSLAKVREAQIKKSYFSYYHVQPSRKYVKGKFKNISIPKSLKIDHNVYSRNYKTWNTTNVCTTNFDKIKIICYVPTWNYKQFSTSSNNPKNDVGNSEPTSNNSQNEDSQNDIINLIKKKKAKQCVNKKESRIVKYYNKGANGLKITMGFIKKTGSVIKIIIFQPSIIKVHYDNLRKNIKHTVDWVKTGILLFLTNMKISKNLIIKRLKGHRLSYSEYKLLIRTINDMFKLIPFSFFVIVPFAEFLLPVVLKIYPNLLPSTFKNNDDNFNNIKKNLYAKQQLSKFLQQLIEEKEKQLNENIGIDSDKKKKILNKFHQQLINKDEEDVNPFLNVNDTLKIAKIFKEEFVLDQMNLKTLQTICHLLGLKPYSIHYHVVLQLRHHFLRLQREDRELIYEGVDNLKKNTLVEICKDRGMNFNTTENEMKLQVKKWLELASIKEIPYILLLYIRCVVVTHAIMDIQNETDKTDPSKPSNENNNVKDKDPKQTIDDKQKLIQEAKEKLDDLKMKEQEIKKNINKETNEDIVQHKETKTNINFIKKKNKYMQNELSLLKQICDLQHRELQIAFTALTDLAEKKGSCDINEIIKTMSQRLLDIEKHISELNAHKQIEMDEYFYPEEENPDDTVEIKN